MIVRRLSAVHWRNLAPLDLDVDAPFVVFEGNNGQGKTHVLELVYALSTLKPIHGHRLRDAIQWGATTAKAEAQVRSDIGATRLQLEVAGPLRNLTRDAAKVSDLGEWFGALRCVAFTPDDIAVASGEPALRRRYLDRAAFTAEPAHLDRVNRVRRLLDHKGAALRSGAADDVLDALDGALADAGAALCEARARQVAALTSHVADHHAALAGTGRLALRLRTAAQGDGVASRAQALSTALATARAEERRRTMVLVGPQTDDVELSLDGRAVRNWASRGQVRSVVLALKLAELSAAAERGDVPVFLVDDVGSELDRDRTARLVDRLKGLGAQVFASTTDARWLRDLPEGETRLWTMQAGVALSDLRGNEPIALDQGS